MDFSLRSQRHPYFVEPCAVSTEPHFEPETMELGVFAGVRNYEITNQLRHIDDLQYFSAEVFSDFYNSEIEKVNWDNPEKSIQKGLFFYD